MADFELELDPELLIKLSNIQIDDPDAPIDFEALGIDVTKFQASLRNAFHGAINEQAENLSNTDLSHPLLLGFYFALLICSIVVFKAKTVYPALFFFITSFIFCGMSDLINEFLSENIGHLFETNPFDLGELFITIHILQPLVIFMLLCTIRFLYSFIVRCFCAQRRTEQKQQHKPTTNPSNANKPNKQD
jgi:hypothetical protein